MITVPKFEEILRISWCSETSAYPHAWTPENPSLGQCAVTSLVAQDYLEGDLVAAIAVFPDSQIFGHFFNKIHGRYKDFTRDQLPAGTNLIIRYTDNGIRDGILFHANNFYRYNLLKQKVDANLRKRGF